MRLLRRVDALVFSAVAGAIVLALTVFLAIDLMTVLADELRAINRGQYGWGTAFAYTLYTLPRRVHELFPYATLLGGLLGLGLLAANSELIALRAAGVSKLRIGASTVLTAALLMVPVVWIGEGPGPWGEQRAAALMASARSGGLDVGQWSGVWAREGDRFFNARRGLVRDAAGRLEIQLLDVRIFEFDRSGKLTALYVADAGLHGPEGWDLRRGVRTGFSAERVEVEPFEQLRWASAIDPEQLRLGLVRPRHLPLSDILAGLRFMRENQLDSQAFEAAFWARVFYPVSTLALVLLSVPFAFGTLRSGTFAKRLFVGMVLALAFFFLQRTVVNLAEVYRLDFALVHAIPPLLAVAVATFALRRAG